MFKNHVFVFVSSILCSASVALAFGEPKHTKIEATSQKSEQNLNLTFKVEASKGMQITTDAPWKLELKTYDGLNFSKTELGQGDLDAKLPGFKITTTSIPSKNSGQVEYRLTAFACTENKTSCYREVHQGKLDWTK